MKYVAAWSISTFPLTEKDSVVLPEPDQDLINFLREEMELDPKIDESYVQSQRRIEAAFIIAYYLG